MKPYLALMFIALMASQMAEAAGENCLEKLRICKDIWQKLDPNTVTKDICEICLKSCTDAQMVCKIELSDKIVTSKDNLTTANTYLLGCKQACKEVPLN